MNVRTYFSCLLVLCMLVLPFKASAEDKPADNMHLVIEKIRADKKLFIADNMGLNETEAKGFWPLYEAYQDELFLLRSRVKRLIDNYAIAYEKMTDDTAKKLLDESLTIERLGLELRQTYLPKFQEVLPYTKVARYYQLENKINAAIMYGFATEIPLVEDEQK